MPRGGEKERKNGADTINSPFKGKKDIFKNSDPCRAGGAFMGTNEDEDMFWKAKRKKKGTPTRLRQKRSSYNSSTG